MKKFIILSLLLVLLVFLGCSCNEEQKSTNEQIINGYEVVVLFEVDGCKVYRFNDGWSNRFFTNCQGNVSWTERRGKTNHEMEVPTSIK